MSTLVLKIGFPPGSNGVKYKAMKCKQSWTAKETIEEILKSNATNFPNQKWDEYVLYLPPSSPNANPQWLEDTRLLSSYAMQDKGIIELRKKYQVIRIRFRGGKQRILINVNDPVMLFMPLIAKKFQVENIELHVLTYRSKPLDTKKSLREVGLSTDVIYVLKKANEEPDQEDEEDEPKPQTEEQEENKQPQNAEEAIDLQAAAKSIKDPQKSGLLNWKPNKKKKFEPQFFVLKDKYFFRYKSQNEKKPLGVIDLEKSTYKVFDNVDEKEKKSKEYAFTFEINCGTEDLCICKAENEVMFKAWYSAIEAAANATKMKGVKRVFGVPLQQVVAPGQLIPAIVEQCVKYIEDRALDTVGIFRLSGSAVKIDEYVAAFDRGDKVDLTTEIDPHCVSGLLKLYFRELPEPILTFQLYDSFVAAQGVPDVSLRNRYIKQILAKLPKLNFDLLKFLMKFLGKVQKHSVTNKMAIHNLATVFGPNLLVPPDKSTFQMIQDAPQVNGMVCTLIQDYDFFFSDKNFEQYATALYVFEGQDPSELSFEPGAKILVISQQPDGWWTGQLNGQIGKFPGSYVKLDVKSKKQQFMDEMNSLKLKFQDENQAILQLQNSKKLLVQEIDDLTKENEKFQQSVKLLKTELLSMLHDNNTFLAKSEKYYAKLGVCIQARKHLEDARKSMTVDLDDLKQQVFANNNPDIKKNLKPKSQEKIESLIGIMEVKMKAEMKQRGLVNEAFDDLFRDCDSFIQLLRASE